MKKSMAIALSLVMFCSLHPVANAAPGVVTGYSCDNLDVLDKDIAYLDNELPRIRKSTILFTQVLNQHYKLVSEREMLLIACQPKTQSIEPTLTIVELPQQY